MAYPGKQQPVRQPTASVSEEEQRKINELATPRLIKPKDPEAKKQEVLKDKLLLKVRKVQFLSSIGPSLDDWAPKTMKGQQAYHCVLDGGVYLIERNADITFVPDSNVAWIMFD